MIPLRDSVRSHTFPIVNSAIILVNTLIFLYEQSIWQEIDLFFKAYALVPGVFFETLSSDPFNIPALAGPFFSSMFLHGGWMHFIGNMWFLYIFGDNVEDGMGHGRYLLFYLLCGLGAGAAHMVFNSASMIPTIGASGAISGVMGAYLILHPRGRVLTLIPLFIFFFAREIPAYFFLVVWMGFQIFRGLFALSGPDAADGVAWWAHIGGFLIGLLLIFPFRKPSFHRNYLEI